MSEPAPPKRWHTREDSGIRLDRDGVWWHDDERIEHPKIIETFNVGLSPTDDGRYKLTVGADWCFVQVEDAAYRVLVLDVSPEGELSVRLSDRTAERLELATLGVDSDGVLSCRVKAGRAKARFSRDAQFAFGSLVHESGGRAVLHVAGRQLELAPEVQRAFGLGNS